MNTVVMEQKRILSLDVGIRNLGFSVADVYIPPKAEHTSGGRTPKKVLTECIHQIACGIVKVAPDHIPDVRDEETWDLCEYLGNAIDSILFLLGDSLELWPDIVLMESQIESNVPFQHFIQGYIFSKFDDKIVANNSSSSSSSSSPLPMETKKRPTFVPFPAKAKFSGTLHKHAPTLIACIKGKKFHAQRKKRSIEMFKFWLPHFTASLSPSSHSSPQLLMNDRQLGNRTIQWFGEIISKYHRGGHGSDDDDHSESRGIEMVTKEQLPDDLDCKNLNIFLINSTLCSKTILKRQNYISDPVINRNVGGHISDPVINRNVGGHISDPVINRNVGGQLSTPNKNKKKSSPMIEIASSRTNEIIVIDDYDHNDDDHQHCSDDDSSSKGLITRRLADFFASKEISGRNDGCVVEVVVESRSKKRKQPPPTTSKVAKKKSVVVVKPKPNKRRRVAKIKLDDLADACMQLIVYVLATLLKDQVCFDPSLITVVYEKQGFKYLEVSRGPQMPLLHGLQDFEEFMPDPKERGAKKKRKGNPFKGRRFFKRKFT